MKRFFIASVIGFSVAAVATAAVLSQIDPAVDNNYHIPDSGAPVPLDGAGKSPKLIGEGTWEVGVDVKPGKYKTIGPSSTELPLCYWDLRVGSEAGEITTQGVKDQPNAQGVVTLVKGQFFTTSGCKDWAPA